MIAEQPSDHGESVVLIAEELPVVLAGQSAEVIPQESWFLNGVIGWCATEGQVEALDQPKISDENGLPLVIPGTRYAITLSSLKWTILRVGVALLIDLIAANPVNWTRGALVATSSTVIGILEKVQKLTDSERQVLIEIGRIKRSEYRGERHFPTIEDVRKRLGDEWAKNQNLDDIVSNLESKELLRVEGAELHIVL